MYILISLVLVRKKRNVVLVCATVQTSLSYDQGDWTVEFSPGSPSHFSHVVL